MNLIRWTPFRSSPRWDPVRELEEMSDRLNHLFDQGLGRPRGGQEALTLSDWTPSVDIAELEKEYLIKAELPEVKKEDVKISAQDNVLTIHGERKAEKEEKGKKLHRIERVYGSFERRFVLPDDVDETQVTADFKEGILNIHIPKTPKPKSKAIEIDVR